MYCLCMPLLQLEDLEATYRAKIAGEMERYDALVSEREVRLLRTPPHCGGWLHHPRTGTFVTLPVVLNMLACRS